MILRKLLKNRRNKVLDLLYKEDLVIYEEPPEGNGDEPDEPAPEDPPYRG